jgi:hypothetical protein
MDVQSQVVTGWRSRSLILKFRSRGTLLMSLPEKRVTSAGMVSEKA